MITKIITERYEIVLPPQQEKILGRAWGEAAIKNARVDAITYINSGIRIAGYLAYPVEFKQEGYPCILWNRGGFGNEGFLDHFTARGMLGQLASFGYAVFASMYRGNKFNEGQDLAGGEDLDDALMMMEFAGEIPAADPKRWGIEGWSRGGMMSLLVLTRKPEIKTAVLNAPITDMEAFLQGKSAHTKSTIREIVTQKDEILKRSPLYWAEKLPTQTKYLFIHGAADKTVPPFHSVRLSEKLIELGADVKLVLLEKGDHFLKGHRQEVFRLRKEWYARYLS